MVGRSKDWQQMIDASGQAAGSKKKMRSFLGVTLTGDLVEEADVGLRSCPIPF